MLRRLLLAINQPPERCSSGDLIALGVVWVGDDQHGVVGNTVIAFCLVDINSWNGIHGLLIGTCCPKAYRQQEDFDNGFHDSRVNAVIPFSMLPYLAAYSCTLTRSLPSVVKA